MGRGVARIFQGGVQFAEILLATPTYKNHAPFICKLRGTAFNICGFFIIVAYKRVARMSMYYTVLLKYFCHQFFYKAYTIVMNIINLEGGFS